MKDQATSISKFRCSIDVTLGDYRPMEIRRTCSCEKIEIRRTLAVLLLLSLAHLFGINFVLLAQYDVDHPGLSSRFLVLLVVFWCQSDTFAIIVILFILFHIGINICLRSEETAATVLHTTTTTYLLPFRYVEKMG
jgi:hypothetical protein